MNDNLPTGTPPDPTKKVNTTATGASGEETTGPGKPSQASPPPSKPSETPHERPSNPAPPPASKVVSEGEATEETLTLRKQKKALEERVSTLENERHTLLNPPRKPSQETTEADKQKKSWLDGDSLTVI